MTDENSFIGKFFKTSFVNLPSSASETVSNNAAELNSDDSGFCSEAISILSQLVLELVQQAVDSTTGWFTQLVLELVLQLVLVGSTTGSGIGSTTVLIIILIQPLS